MYLFDLFLHYKGHEKVIIRQSVLKRYDISKEIERERKQTNKQAKKKKQQPKNKNTKTKNKTNKNKHRKIMHMHCVSMNEPLF